MARPAYERVGNAFKTAYKKAGLKQEDVAAALNVDQGTVSRWGRGLQKIDLDYFPKIDDLCHQSRGYLLRLAGYVDDDLDLPAIIATTSELQPRQRQTLLDVYVSLRKRSAPSATVADTSAIKPAKRSNRASR